MGDRALVGEQGPNCPWFGSKKGAGGSWFLGCQPPVRGTGWRASGHKAVLLQPAWARCGLFE